MAQVAAESADRKNIARQFQLLFKTIHRRNNHRSTSCKCSTNRRLLRSQATVIINKWAGSKTGSISTSSRPKSKPYVKPSNSCGCKLMRTTVVEEAWKTLLFPHTSSLLFTSSIEVRCSPRLRPLKRCNSSLKVKPWIALATTWMWRLHQVCLLLNLTETLQEEVLWILEKTSSPPNNNLNYHCCNNQESK